MTVLNVRFVTVRGIRYIRAEDVADLIEDVAATEATDVRERLKKLSHSILHPVAAVPDQGIGSIE